MAVNSRQQDQIALCGGQNTNSKVQYRFCDAAERSIFNAPGDSTQGETIFIEVVGAFVTYTKLYTQNSYAYVNIWAVQSIRVSPNRDTQS